MTSTRLRKLLLGKHPFIPSRSTYKRVVLTSQLCLLTIAICLFYTSLDLYQSLLHGIPIHLSCALLAVIALILNRQGKHTMSRILLILAVNLTIFFVAQSEPIEIGLYIFYVVSTTGIITIFGLEDLKLAIGSIAFVVILFFLMLYFDLELFPKMPISPAYIKFNILVNFVLASGSSIMIIYFLIDINYRSEKVLKENEQEMLAKNEELTKLNTELDKFMYSTSHDLRSPISSVLGLIQLAKMTDDPAEIKTYLEMMEGRLASLNKFIKDISDYSRNARTDVNLEPVLVKQVILGIVEGLKFYPGAERMKVHVEIDENLEIITDSTRFQIILSNLISNSFKYVDQYKENPYIRVSAETNANKVHLQIEDNGVGIPENFLPKIFDMFFQAHEKSEGSGLGLYIVKEAVVKLNGTIEAKSKLEVGSRFEVSLPV